MAVKVEFEGGVKDEESEDAQEEENEPGYSDLVLLYNKTSTLDAV